MFEYFKKKAESKSISWALGDLSLNQKKSVLCLLNMIAISDSSGEIDDNEMDFINNFAKMLKVDCESSLIYLETVGLRQMLSNLIYIKLNQKEFLLVSSMQLIRCDGGCK